MEEVKANYELSFLAKEIGFNEICHYHFGTDAVEFASRSPEGSKNSQWAKCVARPTLSFLQYWFRKNYDIHVFPVPSTKGLPHYDVCIGDIYHREEDLTYEQALSVGLFKSFKMIKQKNEQENKTSEIV